MGTDRTPHAQPTVDDKLSDVYLQDDMRDMDEDEINIYLNLPCCK